MENLPAKITQSTALQDDHLNKSNPRSMFNMLPESFQKAMSRVNVSYFELEEADLEKKVQPTPTLNCLRYRLWDEFNKTTDMKRLSITITDVCSGICTPVYLQRAVFRNPLHVAWLITPPRSYEIAAHESLLLGIKQLRRILEFPLWKDDGKPDHKIAKLQLEVVKMLDARLKGQPIQRIELKQKSLNISATAQEIKNIQEDTNMEELEKRLMALRSEDERHELHEDARPKFEEFKSRELVVPQKAKGAPRIHPKKEY